jgi:ribosomal-protein-alanine N-acetyltransferase
LTVSRVGVAHAAVFAALHAGAFPDDTWDAGVFATLLGQPGVIGLLDERGGFLVLRVAADEAEVLTIGVGERRRGIGGALMRAGIAAAREAAAGVMYLEVAAGNDAALALYRGLGFRDVGRRKRYYAGGGDAVVLRLGLGVG